MQDGMGTTVANDRAPAIDAALFRRVMGSFASGVTVVSTVADGQVRAMTVSAFLSGSLDPALCVISIRKKARMHSVLIETGHFGVSILGKTQEKLSSHFAGAPVAGLAPEYFWVGRTPLLANSAAVIAADIATQYDCGDHTLFIGAIRYMAAYGRAPLVVHKGRYAAVSHAAEPAPDWVMDFW